MALSSNSLAAAVGVGVKNTQFVPATSLVPRKVAIIGTYNPALTIADEVPELITSPEDAANKYGSGFMIHRLAKALYAGHDGLETWVIPQAEAGGAVASAGTITFSGTTTAAGTVYLRISGDLVSVPIASGTTPADVATAVVAAITAATATLPVTAAVDGVVPEEIDVSAKSKGPWGDGIGLSFNDGFGEELPAGLSAAIVAMSGGSGIPDIDDALNGMGTGDDANEKYFTAIVHGYGQDSSTRTKVSTYNGVGNDFVGLYSKTVHRPFRCLVGDVATGSAGLSALTAIGDANKSDRTNGIVAVPGSPNHPDEIAATAMGVMEKTNNNRASENYNGKLIPGVIPGASGSDRWTSEYDNRDTAVRAGISPTKVISGAVYMTNVLTFYHPDNVPVASNGYRSMRNISIIQNLLYNVWVNFAQEKWQGISIVADTAKVSNSVDREKARDVDAVIDDLVALATGFEGNAWIYSAAFTLDKLASGGYVSVRGDGLGFTITLPVVLSGEGDIYDTTIEFDTSLAVFL